MAERNPEPIHVADDQLTHSIKRVVRRLDDVHLMFQARVKLVDAVGVHVQIDFAPVAGTRLSTFVEHYLAAAEREHRERETFASVVERRYYLESNAAIPVKCRADIGNMDHRYDFPGHRAASLNSASLPSRIGA